MQVLAVALRALQSLSIRDYFLNKNLDTFIIIE